MSALSNIVNIVVSFAVILFLVWFVWSFSKSSIPHLEDYDSSGDIEEFKKKMNAFQDDIEHITLPVVQINLPSFDAFRLAPILDKIKIPDLGVLDNPFGALGSCPMDCDTSCAVTNAICWLCRKECDWIKIKKLREACLWSTGCKVKCAAGGIGCDVVKATCHEITGT
jgi:hypothetical protein